MVACLAWVSVAPFCLKSNAVRCVFLSLMKMDNNGEGVYMNANNIQMLSLYWPLTILMAIDFNLIPGLSLITPWFTSVL